MEIWIVGGAIVALMIYVSTRIKRSAASAYAEEPVETQEFSLLKPEGFLSPVREDSEFAFEAFSKDFGEGEAEKFRQATAHLRVFETQNFAEICEQARRAVDKITTEEIRDEPGGIKTLFLRAEKSETGVETEIYRKIVGKNGKTFDLQIQVLKASAENFSERAEKLLAGFRVK